MTKIESGKAKDSPNPKYEAMRSLVQVLATGGEVEEANKVAKEMAKRWPEKCLNNNLNENSPDEKR